MEFFKHSVATLVTLFVSLVGFSQCNTANFIVTKVNGTCFSNGSITVTVPTSTDCSAWVAEVVKTSSGSTPVTLTVPTTGGNVLFSSLTAGNYNISLSNGFTTLQYANNPVALTSSYVNMGVSSTSNPPVCTNTSPGYAPNGTLTANVTGGTGPFFYKLITSVSTQTATSSLRTYTFNNVPGGEQVTLQVTDQVNGTPGCENTISQTPTTVTQTAADLRYGFRAYNFIRQCGDCATAKLFINLDNLTTARKNILIQPGNAIITISGIDYPLTYISAQNRFTYDPVATGGPNLVDGLQIKTTFNLGCKILTRTNTVDLSNNFLNVFPTVLMNPDCSFKYKITVIGDSDSANTGYIDRNVYFCESNTVVVERRISTNPDVWQVVSGSDISPDPANSTNDLNVVGAFTASIPSAAASFFVYQTGVYRVTASDACHSASKTITDTIPINSLNAVSKTSVLSGTVGFEVPTNSFTGQYPITVKVERVDGQTSMPITATNPLSLSGNYTINFPITKTFSANPAWFNILDLPPGNYKIEYSDGCTASTGNKKIQTINLTNVAGYNPQFSVVEGCSNSNKINFNLNPNSNSFLPTNTQLKTPSGALVQSIAGTSGEFNNVASGNYILNFTTSGASGTAFSAALNAFAPFNYIKPIIVAPFQNYGITTTSILCDLNDPNSGIVSARVLNGTIIYPLTFSLYSTADATTPVQGPFTVTTSTTSYVFTSVPIGNYFVRVSSACFSLDKNLTVSSVSTVPTAQVSNSTICPGSPTTVAIVATSQSLFDITWYANGQVVGTGMPITLAPTDTTIYTAVYTLKSNYGCTNIPEYTSNVTVTVTPNPNLGLSVSDVNLCDGTSPSITISNTQNEFSYEIVDTNGFSFSPPLIANGNGGSLSIVIPNTITLVAGKILKVKATNGNAGCTGLLTDVSNVLNGTFNITCPTFPPTSLQCYADLPSQTSYTIAQFQALGNGNGIIDVVGCGVLEITASNGANPGCNANVIRTYTITEYADPDNNDIRNPGENTVLKTTTCPQTININDTTAPVVTGALADSNTNGCSITDKPVAMTTVAELESAGVTILDNCTSDANLIVTSLDGTPSGTCPITFTRTYTIKDACNNATTINQTININDTTTPVVTGTLTPINLNGCPLSNPIETLITVAMLELAGVSISDNCTSDANLIVTSVDSNATGTCPITFTRTYTIKDACNNTKTTTQTINIIDTTPPDFSGILPQNITLECNQTVPSAATLTATDNCAGLVTISFTEQNIPGTCPNNYTIVRTWVATDVCGNSKTHTQQITIQDTTPPVFVGSLPSNEVFAKCDGIPVAPILTATDNCGTATVTYSEVKIDGDCTNKYRLERTWTATDLCGNKREITQTVYLACYVTPYNALSPDGDGLNDTFIIEGLECYPNNTVQIVNRWGVTVFEAAYYDNVNTVFRGFSDGRTTVTRNDKLPTGNYWYILKYEYDLYGTAKENIEKIGYIYIQNE
jgi:gliding motility-associated-like protein